VIGALGEAHRRERGPGALERVRVPVEQQRERRVLDSGQRRQQVEELQNEPQVAAAHERELLVGQRRHVAPV
jgi:hypothetical protein